MTKLLTKDEQQEKLLRIIGLAKAANAVITSQCEETDKSAAIEAIAQSIDEQAIALFDDIDRRAIGESRAADATES